jgi:hypothetical protein
MAFKTVVVFQCSKKYCKDCKSLGHSIHSTMCTFFSEPVHKDSNGKYIRCQYCLDLEKENKIQGD